MNPISQADLARAVGSTRQAVQAAVRKKRLVKLKGGKIDLDADTTQAYMQASKFTRQTKASQRGDAPPAPAAVSPSAEIGAIIAVEQMDREQAEKQKLIEQILAMQVKTAKERKDLVSRDGAGKVFAKLAAVDTSELHPLGDSIGAEVAAAFGHDDNEAVITVKKIIDKRVFRALKHRKRIMEDFLKKIGGKG